MANLQKVVFGGGCFWCYEAIFSRLRGVVSAVSGYSGAVGPRAESDANYPRVSMGTTGHAEVVEITYDPSMISYEALLDAFFHLHDPTQENGQGADIGAQYRSVIFYTNEEQEQITQEYLVKLQASGEFTAPIVTEIAPLVNFFPAESYHQKYYDSNPDAPYCQVVISPKINKLMQKYSKLLK